MDTLAKRYQRTRTSMYRVINEVRAQRLLEQPLDYIAHDSFDDPAKEADILAPMLELYRARDPKDAKDVEFRTNLLWLAKARNDRRVVPSPSTPRLLCSPAGTQRLAWPARHCAQAPQEGTKQNATRSPAAT